MTSREFYESVIAAAVSDDVTAYATEAIQKMNQRNEVRKSTLTPVQRANEELKSALVNAMEMATAYTAAELAPTLGVSPQKVSALLRQLVTTDYVSVQENGKKAKTYMRTSSDEYAMKG